ncbi:hypothetical protein AAL_04060 [Moelleriella libera RCEF 2490]|uniref:Uncharacterized protein n=1 Tax=Moelleriella libera RCEF 2490 TaxID=1081109 RepID=A0A168CNP4_9HYPO|nr:hypothetical protein AAL_04060 [Moelleriella libera RCEF 2490]
MVRTRRQAAHELHDENTEQPVNAPAAALKSRREKRLPGSDQNEAPSSDTRKRKRHQQVQTDEHENEAPSDPNFYNVTTNNVRRSRRKAVSTQKDNSGWRGHTFEPNRHHEYAGDHIAADDETREADNAAQGEAATEQTDDGRVNHESEAEVGANEAAEDGGNDDEGSDDDDDGNKDDDNAAEALERVANADQDTLTQGETLDNITALSTVTANMPYIEQELAGKTAITANVDCAEAQCLLQVMGDEAWTKRQEKWHDAFVPPNGNDKINWSIPRTLLNKNAVLRNFCLSADLLRNICLDMPRAPDMEGQRRYLAENSQSVRQSLSAIQNCTWKITEGTIDLKPRDASSRGTKKTSYDNIVHHICAQLIPALVVVLSAALALGGAPMETGSTESLGPKDGEFMACTLQIPLRLVGSLSQLYSVMEDETKLSAGRQAFAEHLTALRNTLFRSMRALRDEAKERLAKERLAKERLQRWEAQERKRRRLREEETRKAAYERHMKLFVASTQDPRRNYYDKWGWKMEEDEKLLDAIRRIESPAMDVLVRYTPGRTLEDVRERVKHLRNRMRNKFERQGQRPPRWCYY